MAYLVCQALRPITRPSANLYHGSMVHEPSKHDTDLGHAYLFGLAFGEEDYLKGQPINANPFEPGRTSYRGYCAGWKQEQEDALVAIKALNISKGARP